MRELSWRIKRCIYEDYSEDDRQAVEEILLELVDDLKGGGGEERIAAAALIHSRGKIDRLLTAVHVAHEDWRDILMGSGLEHEDWPERLDSEFGTDPKT
ncbi:hypothetical protein [Streptomyces acidicola]|uniref:Uncharacterized protein n=1 Tax=Streptomyces acidicola TaxID=2596892 RepID=A0A5N8X7W3_9ACTN|nr:hypothetical protein [Streptomyces acidicola]MPY55128.1 hypothetical protein [Streptomyces acidicola]